MHLVDHQQERLVGSATTKPISWGRHGYCEIEHKTLRLKATATAKDMSVKLGTNNNGSSSASADVTGVMTSRRRRRRPLSPSMKLSLRSAFMMLGAPALTTVFVYSCENHQCALGPTLTDLLSSARKLTSAYDAMAWVLTMPLNWFTWRALAIYIAWYAVQAIMYAIVPSKLGYGQRTLAGRQLAYKVGINYCLLFFLFFFFSYRA